MTDINPSILSVPSGVSYTFRRYDLIFSGKAK